MNPIIAEHWGAEDHELPGFNCIVYPDGTITILDCYSIQDSVTKEYELFCRPLCDTTIDSIEKYEASDWTGVDQWARIDYQGGSVIGGDGAMGNEGFIACTSENNNLLWGIFFSNTNPIKSLNIEGHLLIAINEHSEIRIEIDLENLTNIKMTTIQRTPQLKSQTSA
ncbi:MAG: hypothetical protein LBD04_09105 [Synergistaceae bacterium]|jgi:hypothetical protein|nr:hypothetical protein [Synergistaceae bacterium]